MIFQLHQTKLYDYLVYDSTESQIKHHIPHPFHRLIFRFSIRNVLVVVLLLFFSFFFLSTLWTIIQIVVWLINKTLRPKFSSILIRFQFSCKNYLIERMRTKTRRSTWIYLMNFIWNSGTRERKSRRHWEKTANQPTKYKCVLEWR